MIDKILEKNKCTVAEAEELCEELSQIQPVLKPVLNDWLAGRPYNDVQIEGYSIQSLMDNYQLEFTGALLTLDWICRDSAEAIKALEYGIR